MELRPDPIQKLLTLRPNAETSLAAQGFLGSLYQPEHIEYPGKALIVVTGMDGSYSLSRLIAEQFVRRGLAVLALAYWNQEGLPGRCSHIPLETAQRAALWLQKQGYEQIGMWGISLGAVYALLCGSFFPALFRAIVAVSPMNVCIQAMQSRNSWYRESLLCEGSAFCCQGTDIPFSPGHTLSPVGAPNEAQIPAERLGGPLLLLAADRDEVWSAGAAADAIVRRLQNCGFSHPLLCRHYPLASHYLLPCQINARRIFSIEREQPESCAASNQDAFETTLDFLKNQW